MMDPIRAWLLVIDGEPSLSDTTESLAIASENLVTIFIQGHDLVEVVPVEIREVGE